jgi:hypothetical protein
MSPGVRHEDRDFAHGLRQARRSGERLDQFPDGTAKLRKMQPGVPGADKLTVYSDGLEALEVRFDDPAHVFVEGTLLSREVGGQNQRQTHGMISIEERSGGKHGVDEGRPWMLDREADDRAPAGPRCQLVLALASFGHGLARSLSDPLPPGGNICPSAGFSNSS